MTDRPQPTPRERAYVENLNQRLMLVEKAIARHDFGTAHAGLNAIRRDEEFAQFRALAEPLLRWREAAIYRESKEYERAAALLQEVAAMLQAAAPYSALTAIQESAEIYRDLDSHEAAVAALEPFFPLVNSLDCSDWIAVYQSYDASLARLGRVPADAALAAFRLSLRSLGLENLGSRPFAEAVALAAQEIAAGRDRYRGFLNAVKTADGQARREIVERYIQTEPLACFVRRARAETQG